MKKTGVLLLNFGGPNNLKEVAGFLYRLFSDPNVLIGIRSPFRQLLAALIVLLKTKSSKAMYASIGGASPQLHWTMKQASGLSQLLSQHPNVKLEIGMLLSEPSIKTALQKLRHAQCERLVLLPLFSQYSKTTTQSCLDQVSYGLEHMRWAPEVITIRNWCDNPQYISLLRKTIEQKIAQVRNSQKIEDPYPYVLFSAHSLPMKIVNSGDTYLQDVEKTVALAAKDLAYPWSLAYQSRNGPVAWAKPYVETEIPRLAKSGVRSLIVVPVSFVCDHIETLFEIDQVYADLAKQHGIENFYRTRCFNDDVEFPYVLKAILDAQLVL